MEAQVLDSMDLEKEKGITIKSHAIQMDYVHSGEKYVLNLIDTPGHVDFSYEVSRAIASCEGALLVVDATQGIQAQTISNLYLAIEHDLEIIPVLNKIDVDSAMVDVVTDQVVDLLGCKPEDVLCASSCTERRSRCAVAGPYFRFGIQFVQGNHRLFQDSQRQYPYRRQGEVFQYGQNLRCG